MSIKLSDRVNAVKPSPTLAIAAKAGQMKAEGKDIISLSVGEPDFDTPDHIKAAAVRALDAGFTKYTAVDGTPSLKKAVIAKFKRDNGLEYQPKQILVSSGGKQSFFNLVQALINPGDEVIIPAPYWVSYPDIVLLADGVPVIVEAKQSQQFKITPAQLRAAITPKTKLFVINSPSNPTGISYTLEDLKGLAEVLKEFPDIVIATDDMYEHIVWEKGSFVNILNAAPELYDRTLVLNGVSKAYSMTGWRIGYAAGPAAIIAEMSKVQSQSTSNPTSIAQVAAEEALNGDQSCIDMMNVEFKKRHDATVTALNEIAGVQCLPTDGTFYLFPNVEQLIARLGMNNDLELSAYLLDKAGIAVVPGSAFGAEGHIRLSIATSMENLVNAVARIKAAV
jgi:aspartate aminotransferase